MMERATDLPSIDRLSIASGDDAATKGNSAINDHILAAPSTSSISPEAQGVGDNDCKRPDFPSTSDPANVSHNAQGVHDNDNDYEPPTSATTSDPDKDKGFAKLNPEILMVLVTFLDAPTAVCLALTNHKHCAAVLEACKVDHLRQVCPKDVRAKHPKAIESNAWNVLRSKKREYLNDVGWTIQNCKIPKPLAQKMTDASRAEYMVITVEGLAYIRRQAWMDPNEVSATASHAWKLVRSHLWQLPTWLRLGRVRITTRM